MYDLLDTLIGNLNKQISDLVSTAQGNRYFSERYQGNLSRCLESFNGTQTDSAQPAEFFLGDRPAPPDVPYAFCQSQIHLLRSLPYVCLCHNLLLSDRGLDNRADCFPAVRLHSSSFSRLGAGYHQLPHPCINCSIMPTIISYYIIYKCHLYAILNNILSITNYSILNASRPVSVPDIQKDPKRSEKTKKRNPKNQYSAVTTQNTLKAGHLSAPGHMHHPQSSSVFCYSMMLRSNKNCP